MDGNLEKFNNTLQKFVNELDDIYGDSLSEEFLDYYNTEEENDVYLNEFYNRVKDHTNDLYQENLSLLENPLLSNLTFSSLSLSASSLYSIFRYLK